MMTTEDYKLIKLANVVFLFCIIFEVVGIMTILFLGTLGAEMAIYFMTFLFSFFIYIKHKNEIEVPIKKLDGKTLIHTVLITICSVPIAMLLNLFAGLLSNAGADAAEDVNTYPVVISIIAFAIVPAVVEEFVFRGVILGAYSKVDVRVGIVLSSLFFALLHFSLGSVLYGFFFGLLFAVIRLSTGNMLYTVIMHCLFNSVNVSLSYMRLETIPIWIFLIVTVVSIAVFVILVISFFRKNGIKIQRGSSGDRYEPHRLITKEGYITMAICLSITAMLLTM